MGKTTRHTIRVSSCVPCSPTLGALDTQAPGAPSSSWTRKRESSPYITRAQPGKQFMEDPCPPAVAKHVYAQLELDHL